MRNLSSAFLATLIALPLAAACAGGANDDTGDCKGELIQFGFGDATPGATIYYVVTGDTPDQGWGYVEMNGEAGLQRGGCHALRLGTDPCQTESENGADWLFY